MQRYTRLSAAIIFGSTALLTMLLPLLFQKLPEANELLFPQLPPALVFGALWPPVLTAILIGAAFGSLFTKTPLLRLGALYAVCLGGLLWFPLLFVTTRSRLELEDFIFTLTAVTSNELAVTMPVGVYALSKNNGFVDTLTSWLPGPLAGVLTWAWLRLRRR